MTKSNWKAWIVGVPSALVISCCTLGTIVGNTKSTTQSTANATKTITMTNTVTNTTIPTWTIIPTITATNVIATITPEQQAIANTPVIEKTSVTGNQQSTSSYPCKDGQIKANIKSNKYHIPSGQFYDKTTNDVICFDTAQEAENAGFVQSKR